MLNVLYVLLAAILFVDCAVLILLILLQLPKKEAGAGMAFGGSATDALFGAGSGNALTTITRYAAGVFFGSALLMAIINGNMQKSATGSFEDAVTKSGGTPGQTTPALSPAGATNSGIMPQISPTTPASSNSSAPAPASNSAAPVKTPAPATNK